VTAAAYVVEAALVLGERCEAAAVGAAVTVELCGHWEHDGACRWPHNNALDTGREPPVFRTVFVADEAEEPVVRERIEASLRRADAWSVISVRARPPAASERGLAARLLAGPRS
jgi:hypothetical protein